LGACFWAKKFGQKGLRQKWKKGRGSSPPVMAGTGVNGLKRSFNTLTTVPPVTGRERALAVGPPLTSSPLTKFGITYTQVLQEEKIFPMTLKMRVIGLWSLKYARKCLEIE